jgi:hypothetical protein
MWHESGSKKRKLGTYTTIGWLPYEHMQQGHLMLLLNKEQNEAINSIIK